MMKLYEDGNYAAISSQKDTFTYVEGAILKKHVSNVPRGK